MVRDDKVGMKVGNKIWIYFANVTLVSDDKVGMKVGNKVWIYFANVTLVIDDKDRNEGFCNSVVW